MNEIKPGKEDDWVAAARLEQIPEGSGLCVILHDTPIALFKWEDWVYAIDDRCPHMGSSLAAGRMENGVVECPRHGWRFRITDGAWVSCPKNRNPTFPTRVENGVVYLKITAPAS